MGEPTDHPGEVIGVEETPHERPQDRPTRVDAQQRTTSASFPASQDRSLKDGRYAA
jgi:hypothetical protein